MQYDIQTVIEYGQNIRIVKLILGEMRSPITCETVLKSFYTYLNIQNIFLSYNIRMLSVNVCMSYSCYSIFGTRQGYQLTAGRHLDDSMHSNAPWMYLFKTE